MENIPIFRFLFTFGGGGNGYLKTNNMVKQNGSADYTLNPSKDHETEVK